MILQTWGDILNNSFQNLWNGVISFAPSIIIAIIIFIIGWVVGVFVGKIIDQFLKSVKVDNLLRNAGVEDLLKKAGLHLNCGAFIGGLVKWFIIIVFLITSLDVLGLTEMNKFLSLVLLPYIPKVIISVIILLVGAMVAEALRKVVVSAIQAAGVKSANLLGTITKWAIWIFSVIIALSQLGIANEFLLTFFQGVVIALSLALGLAFGLGGQEAAARYIEKIRQEITNHHDQK